MLEVIAGDLFNSGERVIAHGCNCVGLMGAGVAALVRQRSELAYQKYKRAVDAGVFVLGYAQFVRDEDANLCIYNLGTQRQPGADGSPWGIYLAFCNMLEHAKVHNITRVAIPQIGAGIAGLDWENEVVPRIEAAQSSVPNSAEIVVYVYR